MQNFRKIAKLRCREIFEPQNREINCKLPDNLDETSANNVMHSRRSIPSVFVKSI